MITCPCLCVFWCPFPSACQRRSNVLEGSILRVCQRMQKRVTCNVANHHFCCIPFNAQPCLGRVLVAVTFWLQAVHNDNPQDKEHIYFSQLILHTHAQTCHQLLGAARANIAAMLGCRTSPTRGRPRPPPRLPPLPPAAAPSLGLLGFGPGSGAPAPPRARMASRIWRCCSRSTWSRSTSPQGPWSGHAACDSGGGPVPGALAAPASAPLASTGLGAASPASGAPALTPHPCRGASVLAAGVLLPRADP